MSIIQSIRDRGAWIVGGVISLALIAFILQDGLSRRGSVLGSGTTVGKVNGKSIDRKEFDKKVENASQGNAQQRENLIGQLWNQEVSQILLNQEFDKLGLDITDKELSIELFKPSSPLMNEFRDQQTGQVDVEKAKQAWSQFKKSGKEDQKKGVYEGIVEPTKLQAKYGKFNNIIAKAAYAPKWLVNKQEADNNLFATVSYVAVPYSTIIDSTIKVSDDEIVAYGKKHSKLYEKDEETRTFNYVSFDAIPSAADSAAVKTKLENKKAEFAAATNMETYFAKSTSEMPYYNGHIAGKEIKQQVKDTLIKLPIGGVFGPYLDGNNYVLAKMVNIKNIADSAKVRHILIKTMDRDQRSGQSFRMRDDSTAKHLLDTVEMKLKAGANFDSICLKYSEDDGSKMKGGVYDYFTSGRMVASFNDFAFTQPVGSKGIVKTEYGYHYVEVLGQKGSTPAYNIAYYAKQITLSNETDIATKNEATKFIGTVKSKKDFDEAIKKLNKIAYPADGIKNTDFNVPGLGSNRSLVRWIYENGVGDITETYHSFNNKYIVGIITAINKPGVPSAQTLRPQVESLVKNEKKAVQIISKMKGATLEAMASAVGNGASVQRIDTLPAQNAGNMMLGNDFKFAGAAFNTSNKGKVIEPIAGQNGVFAVKVENIAARAAAPAAPEAVKNMLNNTIKNAGNRISNELLKKAADIKDNRAELY
ncbi:MAG: peptidylprolyl isomerase [Chitinophagaceae bacterium]